MFCSCYGFPGCYKCNSSKTTCDVPELTSLYQFVLCILINRCLRSLLSSVMTTTIYVDENGKYTLSFYLPLLFPLTWVWLSVIVVNPFERKYILWHSNPAVRTPTVNYEQFSLFPGKAISSLRFNPLGVQIAPKETENNASAKLWGDKQRSLWVWYGIFCSGQ